MTRPNERARAWAWHVAYALAAALSVAIPVGVGVLAVLSLGPVIGATIAVILAVALVGTGCWWASGRTRP